MSPQASQKVLGSSSVGARKRWRRHIGLPPMMKLRGKELLSAVLKGGGAVTVSTLQRLVSTVVMKIFIVYDCFWVLFSFLR